MLEQFKVSVACQHAAHQRLLGELVASLASSRDAEKDPKEIPLHQEVCSEAQKILGKVNNYFSGTTVFRPVDFKKEISRSFDAFMK